jgi:MIP family channel proteins
VEDTLRRSVAEFIGTFTLIFAGAGAVMLLASSGGPGLLGIAFAHGLAIAIMVSALGHISGGHFNPAITFAFVITRRITGLLAGCYWVAQFAGAAAAALLLKWIFPTASVNSAKLGVPQLASQIGSGRGVAMEIIMTFFLVLVVFATAVDPRGTFKSIAGLAIGLTITMDVLVGGPLTGAAMNPARAFGPQLVQDYWANGWIWYVGPVVGGVIAGLLYQFLYLRPLEPEPVGPPETGVEEPGPGRSAVS